MPDQDIESLRLTADKAHRRIDDIAQELPVFRHRLETVEKQQDEFKPLLGMVAEIKVKIDIMAAERNKAPSPWMVAITFGGWILTLVMFILGQLAK